jgi:hypothetical protein|nr:MAG TPA: hypothetical protein [Caudoviricetes sp.]
MPILDDPQQPWNPVHEILRRLGAERHRSREEAVDWLLRVPLAGELTDLAPEWRQLVAERCVFRLESSESWWSSPLEVLAEEVGVARREAEADSATPEQLELDI